MVLVMSADGQTVESKTVKIEKLEDRILAMPWPDNFFDESYLTKMDLLQMMPMPIK